MTPFDCGCTHDGATRCDEDRYRACHDAATERERERYGELYGFCPPCRLARLRSVSLSSKATPTRRGAA